MTTRLSNLVRAGAVAGLMLAGSATAALADDQRDFDIVNGSTSTITKLYVAPSASSEWGPQLLQGPIGPGGVLHITFTGPGVPGCQYDVHISYNDDRPDQLNNVVVCNINSLNVADSGITFTLAGQ
ncbi:MAG TPA: hypothetical protein VK009_07490 [Chloroflexota bacterium]|nr:hypothetical protein [Chloroflexota bacterium]